MASLAAPCQQARQFGLLRSLDTGEKVLSLNWSNQSFCRLLAGTNLKDWLAIATLNGGSMLSVTDSAAPFFPRRFYSAYTPTGAVIITGDHIHTTEGDLIIHPMNHATLLLYWNGRAIYADPTNSAAGLSGLPKADLILLTHSHNDHFNTNSLFALTNAGTVILGFSNVINALHPALRSYAAAMTNGSSTNVYGINIQAVPAYNTNASYHPKGVGNGYVLSLAGLRIYISGDTDAAPELNTLTNLDVAFICMRLPYTMDITNAALLVRRIQPRMVYPYHFMGSDVELFKRMVGTDLPVEVRLRKWY